VSGRISGSKPEMQFWPPRQSYRSQAQVEAEAKLLLSLSLDYEETEERILAGLGLTDRIVHDSISVEIEENSVGLELLKEIFNKSYRTPSMGCAVEPPSVYGRSDEE